MEFEFVHILQLLLVFQSSIFATFLLTQGRGKRVSNLLLAGFLVVLAVHMSFNLILESSLTWIIPDITNSFGFLYGPLLFLYIKSLAYKEFQLRSIDALHALPWLILLILNRFLEVPVMVSGLTIFVSIVFYLFSSFRLIRYFHRVIRNTQSRFNSIALIWMQRVLYSMIFIAAIDVVHQTLIINNLVLENVFYGFLIAALLFFVTTLVFNGLRQPELFQGMTTEDEQLHSEVSNRYTSSKLTDAEIQVLSEKISAYFDQNSPHLDPELNVQKLADLLELSTRVVSEVINRQFDQNFSDFVNSHRVKDAIRLLEDPDDTAKTVLEVLYEVGFNSKSSFYAAFKLKTGMTPTAYKKQLGV